MTVLEISDLTLTLPDTGRPVLNGVSLHIAEGETVALVGESGSGKTLTARSVIRLLPNRAQASGTIKVTGQDAPAPGRPGPARVRCPAAAAVRRPAAARRDRPRPGGRAADPGPG